jgi:hypothetical protein
MHRKAGDGDVVGRGRWSSSSSFEKSDYLLVESPVKKAFLSTIQADLSCTNLFHDALRVYVFFPGVVGGLIEMIVIDFQSKHCIYGEGYVLLISGRKGAYPLNKGTCGSLTSEVS